MAVKDPRLALAQKRVQALDHLHQCTSRQAELIHQGDLDGLLTLLQGEKQRALLLWGQIEKQWKTAAQDDRPWPDAGQHRLYREQVQRGHELLERIVHLEQQCQQHMHARRQELSAQMQQANRANQAAQAYTGQPQPASGQLDLLSDA